MAGAVCNCCGDCCKVISTAKPLRAYREGAKQYAPWVEYWRAGGDALPEGWEPGDRLLAEKQHADCSFVAAHWHRISQAEAAERLPGMGYPGAYFYACDMWDSETKLCRAGDGRPPICKDFPWYGRPPGERPLHRAFRRCAYWGDVDPELRPPTIALIQIQRREVA
jgi:Fe-S-cluster containining protein